jgi:nucleotide-binding universal stress UspA family protein
MIGFRSILCPTDLTPESDEALRYATVLAHAYEAKLYVCYCEEATAESGIYGHLTTRDSIKLFGESIAKHIVTVGAGRTEWEGLIAKGITPAEAIVNEAAERMVDLIVMHSRRRPHLAALLGSTTEAVCRTAPCPVLVTHTDERKWTNLSSEKIDLKKILVAYDFSTDSELALQYALSLTEEYKTELHLLHVVAQVSKEVQISSAPYNGDSKYDKTIKRLQKVVPSEANLCCKARYRVTEGKPYREVLSYAEDNEIDLICMGANGAGFGMQALFGSNVDRVIRQAKCPILIARPLKPAGIIARGVYS